MKMTLLSGCALLCLLLFGAGSAGGEKLQCAVSPVGVLHPVQAQLERFEAGPGCAAREGGAKETHVIAVGSANQRSGKLVTVVLRPLSNSRPVSRPVILVLSSQHAVHWFLESEGLPEMLHVLVQVSANSTVEFGNVPARVHSIPTLPWRARALLQWTLQRHSTITSLTHSARANRIYLRLGEDPSMPSVCHLQSLFLSHNYLASELQQQEANGCTPSEMASDTEVHVIKLWSAGSGLCGSLQVEVSITLLPSVADAGWYNIVLVLSSAAPVNFALVTTGLRGHITVYSSHSVTPLYPPKPDLTMSTIIVPDLLMHPDLLAWTKENDYSFVMSYTEANLANRFVIKLRGRETVQEALEAKEEETRFRQWLSREDDDGAESSQEVIRAQCLDGRLTVSVDKQILQALSPRVLVVTLRDPSCQAQSNGSHFLLAFPVISCGTEAEIKQHSREMQYKNTVLLWKRKPRMGLSRGTKWKMSEDLTPVVIHFSCAAPFPTPPTVPELRSSRPMGAKWRSTASGPLWFITPHGVPLLSLQLFASKQFERRTVGPCIVTINSRVYAEISGSRALGGRLELSSCVVSPLSDPRAHPGWPVVQDFCPADPSFSLENRVSEERVSEEEEEGEEESDEGEREVREGEQEREEEEEEAKEREEDRQRKKLSQGGRREETSDEEKEKVRDGLGKRKSPTQKFDQMKGKTKPRLRFSFVLRPVFNNSIQFLHCSLQLCGGGSPAATAQRHCTQRPSISALIPTPAGQQCEYRNLSRPVLVTYSPTDGLVGLLPPPAGQLAQKPAAAKTEMSRHSSSDTVADTGLVVVIVFAAFLLGISLMGALWCIYSCTGKPAAVHRDSYLETTEYNSNSWNPVAQLEQASSSV
ncbi:hypothetical protein SRHO_G00011930 [Serrasalmus rhombeus]